MWKASLTHLGVWLCVDAVAPMYVGVKAHSNNEVPDRILSEFWESPAIWNI